MIKRMFIMLLIFGLFVGGLAYYKYSQFKAAMSAGWSMPPESVTSIVAKEEVWQRTFDVTGSFSPVQGVMVGAEEAGKVVKIAFESNQKVNQGDLLVQLDISVEEAQLKSAEAKAELAKNDWERAQALKGTSALSQQELDDRESQLKQANADVEQLRAIIDRKTIKAPFAGITGIRQIQLGQYLSPGSPVVPLQTLDPIYLDFAVSQQFLSRVQNGQMVLAKIDSFPLENFIGKVVAINPEVDNSTRTTHVRAEFKNDEEKIRPGMFAKVTVVSEETDRYITVPMTSILRAPYGNSVYVIEKMKDPKGKEYLGVKQQFVKLGPTRGDQIAVADGLKGGEEIVTSGLFKLRQGASVRVNNEIEPENNPDPQPADS